MVVVSPLLILSGLLFALEWLVGRRKRRSLYVSSVYRWPLLYELHSRVCTFPVWDDTFENIGGLQGLVLYLACGTGNGTGILERAGARLVCMDLNERFVRYGTGHRTLRRALVGDAYALPFRSQSFDNVVIAVSLHHLLDVEKVLGECSRVVRAGGSIVLYDPVSLKRRACRIANTFHDGPIWIFDCESLRAAVAGAAGRLGLEISDVSFFRPPSVQNFNPVYPMAEVRVALRRSAAAGRGV